MNKSDSQAQSKPISRRTFIKIVSSSSLTYAINATTSSYNNPLPRWRGFNILSFFQAFSRGEEGSGIVKDEDLQWIRDWGFDFIRLPMDYWLWIDSQWRQSKRIEPADAFKIYEPTLEKIDCVVDKCSQYGLHLSLNFHRAPGYCINNPEREPFILWKDQLAKEAFVFHWEMFAKRYRGVSSSKLSFNLLNEAPTPKEGYMTKEDYVEVMKMAIAAIRKYSPDRIIIVDGLNVGTEVVEDLISTKVAQSVHAYWPAQISHYRAVWVDRNLDFPTPSWPMKDGKGNIIGDRKILEQRFAQWGNLTKRGIGVHCGECGCFNKTPYSVFISWFTDVMEILYEYKIGYALWNFSGPFGLLDSGRSDAIYVDWYGHKLDINLLKLLQRF